MKEKFVAALLVFLCLTVRSFADEGDVVSAPATDSLVVGTTVIGDVLLECADKGSWTFSMGPKTMSDGTLELTIELSSPTAAVPPKAGSKVRPTIGCMPKIRNEPRKIVVAARVFFMSIIILNKDKARPLVRTGFCIEL